MHRVFLISCSKNKAADRRPARLLYTSRRFVAARTLAEQSGEMWFILSGKHGLIDPTECVSPYDFCLADQSEDYQQTWARAVARSLEVRIGGNFEVVLLASLEYSRHLGPLLRPRYDSVWEPLRFREDAAAVDWLTEQITPSTWTSSVNRLHHLLHRLEHCVGAERLRDCRGAKGWPKRGVYFFIDDGERRFRSQREPRIVRVGTHGVSVGSEATLWNRVRTHRGGADLSGNHRSSIFRLHVGAAMQARDPNTFPETWGIGQSASRELRLAEQNAERMVSEYIGNLRVLCLAVSDTPSADSDRAYLEQNCVRLLSGRGGPLDPPTSGWLGNWSPKPLIRWGGLWNVDYVGGESKAESLDVLETYVVAVERGSAPPTMPIAPVGWRFERDNQGNQNQLNFFPGAPL
jgi:hypothetical protein